MAEASVPEAMERPSGNESTLVEEETEILRGTSDPESPRTKGMQLIKFQKPKPLLEYSKLPEYLRDNEYIHKHYRADWSLSQALWSVFGIHNETGNIWTHLVGFWIFLAITVYTAMKIPSVIETPLPAPNLYRIQDRLPPAPSLTSIGRTIGSHLPKSLTSVEVPQLRQLQKTLSNLEIPQVELLKRLLSQFEIPRLAQLRKNIPSINVTKRMEALYKSLPRAPQLSNLEVAARLEALYAALPSIPKLPDLPHMPRLSRLSDRARSSGGFWYQSLHDLPNMRQVQDKADEYIHGFSERLSKNLPSMQGIQDAAEPFIAAASEKLSHLPKVPEVQEAAEQYLAVMAEWLSQLELLHTLHSLEILTQGMEVSRLQEALHSLISYYSCLLNSSTKRPVPDVCPLDSDKLLEDSLTCQSARNEKLQNVTASHHRGRADGPMDPLYSSAPSCPAPMLYSTPTVRWPLFLFLGGAMTCLLLSASCHLLGCVSCEVSRVVWRFDYAGIAGLISSSFFPPVFYGFLCQPTVRTVYLTAVVVMGISTVAVSLLPQFQGTSYRHIRAALFFGMGASGLIPTAHKFFVFYDEPTRVVITTTLMELLMGALYGLGALFYATRVPERWLPGKFDIAGHSHQIFHVLVIAGAYTHYQTGLLYLQWRDSHGCEPMSWH